MSDDVNAPRRGPAGLLPKQMEFVKARRKPLLDALSKPRFQRDAITGELVFDPRTGEPVPMWANSIVIYRGGWRSGKTTGLCAKAIDNGRRHWPHPVLAVEPTFPMIRSVFVDGMVKFCKRVGLAWRWQETQKIFTVGRPGRYPVTIWCRSADSRESLEGVTAGSLVGDEWELWDPEILTTAMARVSAGPEESQQIALGGTPEGFGPGWELLEKDPAETTSIIVSRSSDNFFVRPSYVGDMRGRMSEEEASEKLDGVRTPPSSRVYTRFDRKEHCLSGPCVNENLARLELWCDFNEALMAWGVVLVDDAAKAFHVVGQIVQKHTDSQRHAVAARAWLIRWYAERNIHLTDDQLRARKIVAICDASSDEKTAVAPLTHVINMKEAGFVPRYALENPRVEDRVASVQKVLGDGRLTFDEEAAEYIVRCISMQPKAKDGSPNKDPALGLDHGSDVVGYGVMMHSPGFRPSTAYQEAARAARWERSKNFGSGK